MINNQKTKLYGIANYCHKTFIVNDTIYHKCIGMINNLYNIIMHNDSINYTFNKFDLFIDNILYNNNQNHNNNIDEPINNNIIKQKFNHHKNNILVKYYSFN